MGVDLKKVIKDHGLLTVKQYAEKSGFSPWYIAKLCRKELLDCQRLPGGGGAWLINPKSNYKRKK